MTRTSSPRANELLPLDRLIGRGVIDRAGQPAGRIEEFRVEVRDGVWTITEYVLGVGGLLERLNVGVKLLLGRRLRGRVARADQIDISNPERPRLTCRRDALKDT